MDPQIRQKHLENRRKSLGYGNQALRTSVIEQGLKQLTKAVIEKFREVIGCERASILYNDSSSEELVFLQYLFGLLRNYVVLYSTRLLQSISTRLKIRSSIN